MKFHQRAGLVFMLMSIILFLSITHSDITELVVTDMHWATFLITFMSGSLLFLYGD